MTKVFHVQNIIHFTRPLNTMYKIIVLIRRKALLLLRRCGYIARVVAAGAGGRGWGVVRRLAATVSQPLWSRLGKVLTQLREI